MIATIETIMTDDDSTEDENEAMQCDGCEVEISVELYDANDGLCEACLAETFICKGCEGRTHKTDAHAVVKSRCEVCGDELLEERRQERLDAAAEAARDLLEAIIDLDDLAVVKKALSALKRIHPSE